MADVGDLPCADSIYQKQWSCNFQNSKSIPNKFRATGVNQGKHVGRPKDDERYKAFQSVMDEFYENDDRTVMVSE